MLPIAILIDDVYSYLLNEREVSQEIETESSQPKRKRFKKNTVHNDDDLQILMRICCFLIETIEYCSLKLNQWK
ncbi:hypothetical protein QR98_0002170 [Sarcoptes scabiei]|uniref:Uncharacterized protein n=1 Tax=Sarcoptes scabiei TaxID=52283 RepID=A0A131ZSV8_SARSC|nr:hypothetical protein QR98_0002170 [Sarcoptes scabiei]